MLTRTRSHSISLAKGRVRSQLSRLNTSLSFADRTVNAAIKLVWIPLLVSLLGDLGYGMWVTLLAVVGWLGILELGLPTALVNPLTASLSAGDRRRINELVSTATLCLVLVTAIALPVACSVFWISNFHAWESSLIAIALVVLGLPLRIASAVALSAQRNYLISVTETSAAVAALFATWVLSLFGRGDIVGIVIVVFGFVLVSRAVLWHLVMRQVGRDVLPSVRGASASVLGDLAPDAARFLFGGFAEAIVLHTPAIALALMAGPADVAKFFVPYQIFFGVFTFFNAAVHPLWPAYAEAFSSGDRDWIRASHRRVMRRCFIGASLVFSVLAFLMPWLATEWARLDEAPPAVLPWLFALHFTQWTCNYAFVVVVTGLGMIRRRLESVVMLSGVTLILTPLGIAGFGVVGGGAAVAIAMATTQTWFLPWILFREARWIFAKTEGRA